MRRGLGSRIKGKVVQRFWSGVCRLPMCDRHDEPKPCGLALTRENQNRAG
jgi:hypothetical protein